MPFKHVNSVLSFAGDTFCDTDNLAGLGSQCVYVCLTYTGGPPSPALPGVRGGTKPLGTSSFCQFLMIYSALIRSFAGSSSNQNSVGAGGINLTEGQDPEAPSP